MTRGFGCGCILGGGYCGFGTMLCEDCEAELDKEESSALTSKPKEEQDE